MHIISTYWRLQNGYLTQFGGPYERKDHPLVKQTKASCEKRGCLEKWLCLEEALSNEKMNIPQTQSQRSSYQIKQAPKEYAPETELVPNNGGSCDHLNYAMTLLASSISNNKDMSGE